MTSRKTIKITLPADKVGDFEKAKAGAEQAAMIAMTDTQYASRLVQWALGMQSSACLVFTSTDNGLTLSVTGKPGTEEHSEACRAAMLFEETWGG